MTDNNFMDLTLDEKWERLEADVQAWQERGIALDKADDALAANYRTTSVRDMPPEGQAEWMKIQRARQEHLGQGKSLQMVSAIIKKESQVPGIRGFIGRLIGLGYRPGSYRASGTIGQSASPGSLNPL